MGEAGVERDRELDDLVAKIVARASRARGDHDEDSDYDIMIVVDDNWPDGKANAIEAYKLVEGRKIPVDALMIRQSIFRRDKGVIGTLSDVVWAEGRLLHDRDTLRSVA